MNVYDLQPGDLAVLNNLVIVTDLCGICLGAAAGAMLCSTIPYKYPMAIALMITAYKVINVWA